ncbi:MAG: hypothetical protein RLZZ501_272 [Pseudomonadota bacterium]
MMASIYRRMQPWGSRRDRSRRRGLARRGLA